MTYKTLIGAFLFLAPLLLFATPIKKGYGCPNGKCPGTIYERVQKREEQRRRGETPDPLPCSACNQCLPNTPENRALWTHNQNQHGTLVETDHYCSRCEARKKGLLPPNDFKVLPNGDVVPCSGPRYATPREAELGGRSSRVPHLCSCGTNTDSSWYSTYPDTAEGVQKEIKDACKRKGIKWDPVTGNLSPNISCRYKKTLRYQDTRKQRKEFYGDVIWQRRPKMLDDK